MGLTLVELLIVLVIIAILAVIALPSYSDYVMRTRRSEGITALNNINLEQEKHRSNNATYATLGVLWAGTTSSENGHYALAITNPTATGYTVTATAQNAQANDTYDMQLSQFGLAVEQFRGTEMENMANWMVQTPV